MAGNQLPVLTLDFDDDKIKKLDDIATKLKNAFSIGPGGLPFPSGSSSTNLPSIPGTGASGAKPAAPESSFDKFMKTLNKDAQSTLKTFNLINKTLSTTNVALKGLFENTIRWGARVSALSAGSAFGFDYLAKNVAGRAMTSQANGMTTGQMQAAQNVYGTRISNIGGMINGLAAAQNDPMNPAYAGLMGVGIDPRAGAAANLPKLITAIADITAQYKNSGAAQTVLNSMGLGSLSDYATTNQINANRGDIYGLNHKYSSSARALDLALGTGTERQYQNSYTNFQNNLDTVSNTFIKNIARLNGPINRVADELTKDITRFLDGPNGQAVFDTVATGLRDLGSWLANDSFKSDMSDFAGNISKIAKAIGASVDWLAGKVPGIDNSNDANKPGRNFLDAAAVPGSAYLGYMLGGPMGAFRGAYAGYLYADRENIQDSANSSWNYFKRNAGDAARLLGIDTDYGRNGNTVMGTPNAASDIPGNQAGGGNFSRANLQRLAREVNDRYKLPPGLMPAIIGAESSWNPNAINKESGAMGLPQFMKKTGNAYGLHGADFFDPIKSTDAMGRYLHDLDKRYDGDVAKMLTSYNGGRFDKNKNIDARSETIKYLMDILPQVQGAPEQHPGILWQLNEARQNLSKGSRDDRATIQLQIVQTPGSDISAAVRSQYIPQ